jgi:HTH-type transcriptional regulator/antitoxin HipB
VNAFPADRYLRAARRRADLSQREFAAKAGVPQSTIARIEHSPERAKATTVAQLLGTLGFRLAVVDTEGNELEPEDPDDAERRDRAKRRFPAHLDLRPGSESWWAFGWPMFDGREPEYTFDRDRWTRDWRRQQAANAAPRREAG